MNSTSPNIFQRMHAVMQEVDYIQKEKKQGMRYSIVSHDAVTAKVRPLMVKHGIIYYPVGMRLEQTGNRTQLTCQVVFQNIEDRNDSMVVDSAGYGIDDQDKGPGKAISYAVKYALLKGLGLESGDDPDQDQNAKFEPPAVMTAVSGTPGSSKAASRDVYTALVKDIRNAATVTALKAWYQANVTTIDGLPPDFLDELRVEYNDRLSELKGSLAA